MAFEQPVTFTDMVIENHVISNEHLAVSVDDAEFESHTRGGCTTQWATDKNIHELSQDVLEHVTPDTDDFARITLPRTEAQKRANAPGRSYDVPSDQIGSIFKDVVHNDERDGWQRPTQVIARIGSASVTIAEGRIAVTDYPFNSRVIESLFAATAAKNHEDALPRVLAQAREQIEPSK